MSASRFVSGGTVDQPIERDEEWVNAQKQIEEKRQKEQAARQEGGKSLYEVLQANKAAKQEAFEESIRLKNQFRTLDDDEAEFINSVLESTRQKEAAIQKETSEQLEIFRKHQEEAEKTARASEGNSIAPADEEQWITSGRKRKKGNDAKGPFKGLKLRKSSSTSEQIEMDKPNESPKVGTTITPSQADNEVQGGTTKQPNPTPTGSSAESGHEKEKSSQADSPSSSARNKPGLLLLADYSSDDD